MIREGDRAEVLLGDFGLVNSYETAGASGITHSAAIDGTLTYMPPEQLVVFRGVRPTADAYLDAAVGTLA